MADTHQLETMALDAYNRQDFAAARGLWQQSADLGSVTANYNLAMLTLYGLGETPDPAKARALLTKVKNGGGDPEPLWTEMLRQEAAARPDPSAELVHEGLDAYKAGDPVKAMNLWSRASEMGNANASYNLAQLMMYGKGTPVNFVAARALLNRAAQAGHSRAANALSTLEQLEAADNARKAEEEARRAEEERLAAEARAAQEAAEAARRAEEERQAAEAAQAVPGESKVRRGYRAYTAGYPEQALTIWLEAASEGSASAACNLAQLYMKGIGTPVDLKSARAWLEMAANAGHPKAEAGLAELAQREAAAAAAAEAEDDEGTVVGGSAVLPLGAFGTVDDEEAAEETRQAEDAEDEAEAEAVEEAEETVEMNEMAAVAAAQAAAEAEDAREAEAQQRANEEAERLAAEEAARLEAERLAAEEAARLEAERLAAEEAARLEAERLAAEEAARLEAERLAAEEAARLEAERLAAEEAARIAAEEAARKALEEEAAKAAAAAALMEAEAREALAHAEADFKARQGREAYKAAARRMRETAAEAQKFAAEAEALGFGPYQSLARNYASIMERFGSVGLDENGNELDL